MANVTKDGFKWLKLLSHFNEDFIKSYIKDSDIGYFTKADVQDPKKLHVLHNGLSFLSERTQSKKVEKLLADLHDKKEYVIHITKLKQALL